MTANAVESLAVLLLLTNDTERTAHGALRDPDGRSVRVMTPWGK